MNTMVLQSQVQAAEAPGFEPGDDGIHIGGTKRMVYM